MNFPNDLEEEGLSRELEKALFDFEDYYSGLISSEKDTYELITSKSFNHLTPSLQTKKSNELKESPKVLHKDTTLNKASSILKNDDISNNLSLEKKSVQLPSLSDYILDMKTDIEFYLCGLCQAIVLLAMECRERSSNLTQNVEQCSSWLQSIEKELKNIKLNLLAIHQLFIDMESHSLSVLENSAGAMKVYNKSVEDFTKLGFYVESVRQKVSFFDEHNKLRDMMKSSVSDFLMDFLNEHFKHKMSPSDVNDTHLKNVETVFFRANIALDFFNSYPTKTTTVSQHIETLEEIQSDLLIATRRIFQHILETYEASCIKQWALKSQSMSLLENRSIEYPLVLQSSFDFLYKRLEDVIDYAQPLLDIILNISKEKRSFLYTKTLSMLKKYYISSRLRVLEKPLKEKLNMIKACYQKSVQNDVTDSVAEKEEKFENYLKATPLSSAVQQGVALCISLSLSEKKYFIKLFHNENSIRECGIGMIIEFIGNAFVEIFRPFILRSNEILELRALFLSAISDALRCQFWDEEEDPMYFLHREGLGYLLSTFIRLHQDLEERLIFKMEAFLEGKVRNYEPNKQSLNYPFILFDISCQDKPNIPTFHQILKDLFHINQQVWNHQMNSPLQEAFKDEYDSPNQIIQDHYNLLTPSPYYPALENLVACLTATENVIKPATFQFLKERSIKYCLEAFMKATEFLKKQQSSLDANLFLIKHLLLLREHLTRFHHGCSFYSTTLSSARTEEFIEENVYQGNETFSQEKQNVFPSDALSFTEARLTPTPYEDLAVTHYETLLKNAAEDFLGHSSQLLLNPLLNICFACEQIQEKNKDKTNNGNTECFDKQLVSIDIQYLKDKLIAFKKTLESTLSKFFFNLHIYLDSILYSDCPYQTISLIEFPTRITSVNTLESSISTNYFENKVFSCSITLSSMLKDIILSKVKQIYATLISFPYFTVLNEREPSSRLPFTLTEDHLKKMCWTSQEIDLCWETLSTAYSSLFKTPLKDFSVLTEE